MRGKEVVVDCRWFMYEGERGRVSSDHSIRRPVTPLQKESQVRFEMPEEIPLGHEYMMQMLPENQKIKNF